MHEENVVGDTYVGFIHVFEGDEEGIRCDRCRTRFFCGTLMIAFDGAGESSPYDDITLCESCLKDLGSQAQRRAAVVASDPRHAKCSVEWTESILPRYEFCPSVRDIVVRFDWDDGLPCHRCKNAHVTSPIYSFDGTGGIYDSLCVCEPCVSNLLKLGRENMMSVMVDRHLSLF